MNTPSRSQDRLAQADRLMQNRRFAEALQIYEQHLQEAPADAAALLKSGICHLLNRSQAKFLAIYAQARSLLAALDGIPADVQALWRKYEGLVAKVTAGAMVVGGLAVAGCDKPPAESEPQPQPPSATPAAPAAAAPAKPATPSAADLSSSHRYSGGVYLPPQQELVSPAESAAPSGKKPAPSSHRYSGGVFLDPAAEKK